MIFVHFSCQVLLDHIMKSFDLTIKPVQDDSLGCTIYKNIGLPGKTPATIAFKANLVKSSAGENIL